MLTTRRLLAILTLALFAMTTNAGGEQKKDAKVPAPTKAFTVEELAEKAKKSICVILHTGRQGKQAGLGTGFVVDEDGLIATNFHVIGEGRPITVQMADGKKHEVVAIHASDRHVDLAVLRVKATGLTAIPLGDSEKMKTGQAIVALGHPLGLKYSIVAGVLSGRRELENVNMLQIAMPIEPGNSGGPVLDMFGRAVGVVTLKSLVASNLGFAVPSKDLAALLKKPNSVPMDRWVTLGVLDKSEWRTEYGGNWRQRAGRILVDGVGTGFGGRSLCFHQREVPAELPYEATVTVKLDNESGAAGLIFGGDGVDHHFGFYPSGGKLRFTKFDGPDVQTWKILSNEPSEHYRPGEWNTLKVRVEAKRVLAFVNGRQVLDLPDLEMFGKRVGVAKFRETVAEYKKFQVAKNIDASDLPAAQIKKLSQAIASLPKKSEPDPAALKPLLETPSDSMKLLRDRAAQLEKQADILRKTALRVHQHGILERLEKLTKAANPDLLTGALLIANLDNEELDVVSYVREVERMAREIKAGLPKDADDEKKVEAVNTYLFKDRGFHGSRHDYYSRNNSYLNEVIDDREGLPITLSLLYLEIARRLDLKVVGVALPGHFVVRHEPKDLPAYLIDVFEGGKSMTNREAEQKIYDATGAIPKRKDFQAVSKKAILTRMLHNLLRLADRDKDRDGMLRYLDAIVVIDPGAHEERWARAVVRFQANRRNEVLADCDYLLSNANEDEVDLERVRELKKLVEKLP